jgi:hypothetical protein
VRVLGSTLLVLACTVGTAVGAPSVASPSASRHAHADQGRAEGPHDAGGRPVVRRVSPASGSTGGGTVVRLRGDGFSEASRVTFGGTPGRDLVVVGPHRLRVVAPPHAAGSVAVRVRAHGHRSRRVERARFGYETPAPTLSDVSPSSGSTLGGTPVTLLGTGLTGTTAVSFGGTPAASYVVVSDTRLTAVTPAHTAGSTNVVVTTAGGVSQPRPFTYLPPGPSVPRLTGLQPTSGSTDGGTTVVITGAELTGATAVSFGDTPATEFTVDSDFQVSATAPAHDAGPVDVTVTTAGGTSSPLTYTYVAPPPP